MASVRIRGLVRVFNHVRDELRRGIEPAARGEFRDRVEEAVRSVEEICAAHDATTDQLPGPSRSAYRFLKALDLDDLPAPREGLPPPVPVRLSGLVRIGDELADRMWGERESLRDCAGERIALREELVGHTAAVADIAAAQDGAPDGLPARSRRVYAWMKYLVDVDALRRHVEALCTAGEAASRVEGPDERTHVRLVDIAALWRVKRRPGGAIVTVSEGFAAAPPEVWDALMRAALVRGNGADRQVPREFSLTDEFVDVVVDMEGHVRPPGSARGRRHDLDESFARVVAACFGGRMEKPSLVWNEAPTLRKMGHYRRSSDTVMLSVSLDHPEVPEFVVDSVMHHELLHKKHGIVRVLGRSVAHTRAFREEERRFPRYEEARAFLNRWAGRRR